MNKAPLLDKAPSMLNTTKIAQESKRTVVVFCFFKIQEVCCESKQNVSYPREKENRSLVAMVVHIKWADTSCKTSHGVMQF